MKKHLAVFPLLLALYPILALYAHNKDQVLLVDILPVATVSLFATGLLLLFARILRANEEKAVILNGLFVLIFFSYGHIYCYVNKFILLRHRLLFPLILGLLIFAGIVLKKIRRDLRAVTGFLSVVAVVLIVFPLVSILAGLFSRSGTALPGEEIVALPLPAEDMREREFLPDVYYIILDAYADSLTLKELFGYDNQQFLSQLEQRGFYVATASRSNYSRTYLSLASSLNMSYLDTIRCNARGEADPRQAIMMIRDNELMRQFAARGYQTVHCGSWWGATNRNAFVDSNVHRYPYLNDFTLMLLERTMFNIFFDRFREHIARQIVLYTFEKLAEIPTISESTYTFAHIIAPHWPFVFGPNGESIPYAGKRSNASRKNMYLGQLQFINKKVLALIDDILEGSDRRPIIILQADHGCLFADDLNTRMKHSLRIFNAYYLPAGPEEILYASVSPVNSFRIILNRYFNAELKLLPDRSYYEMNMREFNEQQSLPGT